MPESRGAKDKQRRLEEKMSKRKAAHRKKVGPPPAMRPREKGGVYAQAVFGMRGDSTISVRDEDLAFLDHGAGNLPFDFPAMLRLRQLVGGAGRLGKLPKGWVLEIDFHGTTFALRTKQGEDYKLFVQYADEDGWTKIATIPRKGTN